MASVDGSTHRLRGKVCLADTAQFNIWKNKELPKLLVKYPKFTYVRMVDTTTDKNYVWYKIR
jgi:hypothetical protein